MKKDFICQIDGYNYYLGEVVARDIDWFKAKELVDGLGEGWGLPSREIGIIAHNKGFFVEIEGWLWLEECSASFAWGQCMHLGFQDNIYKTYNSIRFVRPMYKEKAHV